MNQTRFTRPKEETKPIYDVRRINNLRELIDSSADLYGDNKAFLFKNAEKQIISKTYKEYKEDIYALGTALMDLHLQNKKIVVIGNNSYRWCLSYMAVAGGVGTIVPLDKAIPAKEIENLTLQAEPACVICEEKYLPIFENINANIEYIIVMEKAENDGNVLSFDALLEKGKELIANGNTKFINTLPNDEEARIMIFTSGTTSSPKAVLLSNKNLCSNVMSCAQAVHFKPDDILLSFLPIHHTFECLATFLLGTYSGSCIAFCDGLKHIAENLKEYNVSVFLCVPAILENLYAKLQKMMKANNITSPDFIKTIFPNYRLSIVGAASISKDTVVGFNQFNIRCLQGYGLTESSPVLSVENDLDTRPGSIGKPLPGVQIQIYNPDSEGIGEIIAKGDNIMLGYYQNDEATKSAIVDGWLHTGDLGYFDEDGFLYIAGRQKNVIVLDNGKNVFPEEIEVILNKSDYITESFVYSVEKNNRIELCAEVVYDANFIEEKCGKKSEEEIYSLIGDEIKEINKTLPLYKYIRHYIITDIPLLKTTTNKIKRYAELKKMLIE